MNSLRDQLQLLRAEIRKNQELLADPELAPLAREEIARLTAQQEALESSLAASRNPRSSQADSKGQDSLETTNALIEIRGAAGGQEAKLWAADLKRLYIRFANLHNFRVQELDEGTLKAVGNGAYSAFKQESGVHRVQRVPETEHQGRIHTSTATVAVLPEIPESQIRVSPEDLEWQFTRAGGPGGQYVNKANTAVRLSHRPSGIVVSVRRERLQQQNKAIALEILRAKLWEREAEKRQRGIERQRRMAVGRGMRAEKIRTYNFPQNRVTDHRINRSWYNLDSVMQGNLDPILQAAQSLSPQFP